MTNALSREGVDFYVMKTTLSDGRVVEKKIPFAKTVVQGDTEGTTKPEKLQEKSIPVETLSSDMLLERISNTRYLGGKVILEVGCGDKLSISLGRKDLWIGVDPDLAEKVETVERGENRVYEGSERVLCKERIGDLPEITPDLVLMVAPNPADITDNSMLSDVLEKAMGPRTRLLMILDTESYESVLNPRTLEYDNDGLQEVQENVSKTFRLSDFDVEVYDWADDEIETQEMKELVGISNPVYINSGFIQGQDKLVISVRRKPPAFK